MWFSKTFLIATLGPVRSIASCASHFLPEFCSGQLEYNRFFLFLPKISKLSSSKFDTLELASNDSHDDGVIPASAK